MIFGAIGKLIGAALAKPPPIYKQVNQGVEQSNAIASNIANFGQAAELARMTNTEAQTQQIAMMERAMPGITKLNQQIGQEYQADISGKLSDRMLRSIRNQTAGASLYGGFGSTGSASNLNTAFTAREAMALRSSGLSNAQTWMKNSQSLFAPERLSIASMFVNPAQWTANKMNEQRTEFNSQVAKVEFNNAKTMGIASAAGEIGDSIVTMGAGGGMGAGMQAAGKFFGG